jgi:hypothetical protein
MMNAVQSRSLRSSRCDSDFMRLQQATRTVGVASRQMPVSDVADEVTRLIQGHVPSRQPSHVDCYLDEAG